MHHFFVSSSQIDWEKRCGCISGPDVHHIVDVLRLPQKSRITVSDGEKKCYIAIITDIVVDHVNISLLERKLSYDLPGELPIRLIQGVAKGSKMDWIIQKNTEMGISAIQPITTQFTVVKFSTDQDAKKKQARWQKIAEEASKQSKRTTIPSVEKPVSLEEYSKHAEEAEGRWLRLLAYEKESGITIRNLIKPTVLEQYDGVELWIGPEGGFSQKEIEVVRAAGIQTIGLGPRILRTETASIVLLSVLLYEMGVLET